jgi:energy-coupling factor transporter transmembrane protein EcfT
MRWLFLSMLIIYFWFTPGQSIFAIMVDYSPTWQGIQMAGYRIGSLVVIVVAVNIVIKSTPKELITSGLLWLLAPLRYVGLPHERLAVRIVLTFNMISEIQYEYDLLKRSKGINEGYRVDKSTGKSEDNTGKEKQEGGGFLQRLDRLGELGANLFTNVVDKAQHSADQSIDLPGDSAPPLSQWGLPLVLAGGFIAVRFL